MATPLDIIDVRRYDSVVRLLSEVPDLPPEEAARRTGVPERTVRRIVDGRLPRPAVVVLERLPRPRRCENCGSLCRDWPCIFCEMRRRRDELPADRDPLRFVYANRPASS